MKPGYSMTYWASKARQPGLVVIPDDVFLAAISPSIAARYMAGEQFHVLRGDGTTSRAQLVSLPANGFRDGTAVVKILGGN